jgi:hypothetical protein
LAAKILLDFIVPGSSPQLSGLFYFESNPHSFECPFCPSHSTIRTRGFGHDDQCWANSRIQRLAYRPLNVQDFRWITFGPSRAVPGMKSRPSDPLTADPAYKHMLLLLCPIPTLMTCSTRRSRPICRETPRLREIHVNPLSDPCHLPLVHIVRIRPEFVLSGLCQSDPQSEGGFLIRGSDGNAVKTVIFGFSDLWTFSDPSDFRQRRVNKPSDRCRCPGFNRRENSQNLNPEHPRWIGRARTSSFM